MRLALSEFPFVVQGEHFETGRLWLVVLLLVFSLIIAVPAYLLRAAVGAGGGGGPPPRSPACGEPSSFPRCRPRSSAPCSASRRSTGAGAAVEYAVIVTASLLLTPAAYELPYAGRGPPASCSAAARPAAGGDEDRVTYRCFGRRREGAPGPVSGVPQGPRCRPVRAGPVRPA